MVASRTVLSGRPATISLGGRPLMTGLALFTVTVKLAVPVLPAGLVAEQVTVVTPGENVEPDAG